MAKINRIIEIEPDNGEKVDVNFLLSSGERYFADEIKIITFQRVTKWFKSRDSRTDDEWYR